jgi:hypothetical protein
VPGVRGSLGSKIFEQKPVLTRWEHASASQAAHCVVVWFGRRLQPDDFVNGPAGWADKTGNMRVRHLRSRDYFSFRTFSLRKRFFAEGIGGFLGGKADSVARASLGNSVSSRTVTVESKLCCLVALSKRSTRACD